MNMRKYIRACVDFSKKTESWKTLPAHYFTTCGNDCGWKETIVNDHNGIDVSWAFHKTETEVWQNAWGAILDSMTFELEEGLRNDFTVDEWRALAAKYTFATEYMK